MLMEQAETPVAVLAELQRLGVHIVLDDFGTGYSSLSRLKDFPLDVLKIDRSFIDRLGDDPDREPIVVAIIAMARALGLRVIAEGVETEHAWQRLSALRMRGGAGVPAVPPDLGVADDRSAAPRARRAAAGAATSCRCAASPAPERPARPRPRADRLRSLDRRPILRLGGGTRRPGAAYRERRQERTPDGSGSRHRSGGAPEWLRVRRVHGGRRLVAAPAPLRALRPRRLLRFLARPARQPPRGRDRAPARQELRAGRGVVLELRDRAVLRRARRSRRPSITRPTSPCPGRPGGCPPDWQVHLH